MRKGESMRYIPSGFVALGVAAVLFSGCGAASVSGIDVRQKSVQEAFAGQDLSSLSKGHTDAGDPVHDPSIIRDPDTGTYWLFGSHMEVAKSEDLVHWSKVYSGANRWNKLFSNLFSEDSDAFDWVGKNEEGSYSVWAPCVIYNKAMQKYCMYFCTSSSYIKSSLCLATADKISGPYTYQCRLLDSGFNRMDAKKRRVDILDWCNGDIKSVQKRYLQTGSYNNMLWPNCIDPTVFYDADGKMWMVYGSWSGGIFLMEIDEATGLPIHPDTDDSEGVDAYFGRHLIGGNHQSCEGPWIQYDKDTGYYYLFVSYGSLQAHGGYQIRLFRSRDPEGPYVDAAGKTLGRDSQQEYGIKMMGNYTFPSLDVTYMAPGHNSMFQDSDGKRYLVYHQRFDNGTEDHEPRVHQLFVNADGWYTAAPFETSGETISEDGYSLMDVCGTYSLVNHGLDISDAVPENASISLQPDGIIYAVEGNAGNAQAEKSKLVKTAGSAEEKLVIESSDTSLSSRLGTFSVEEGSPNVTLTLDGQEYQGVFVETNDEAGNPTMCFSACGSNNETVWGVHYLLPDCSS